MTTLSAFARKILEDGTLEGKRVRPRDAHGRMLDDSDRGPAQFISGPARDDALVMTLGVEKLPRRRALVDKGARATTIARFAHHELMAVELFAWALLAYPDAPDALRRGLAQALEEEQTHLDLYLGRLNDYGTSLADHPRSGYFWKVIPTAAHNASDVRTFLCAMGLTLEQANLDFTGMYERAFASAGDVETAAVVNRVHEDEIGHVRLAATWLTKLDDDDRTFTERYRAHVPFPLHAARAKGHELDVEARKRAGLDDEFIEAVRGAKPYEDRTWRA